MYEIMRKPFNVFILIFIVLKEESSLSRLVNTLKSSCGSPLNNEYFEVGYNSFLNQPDSQLRGYLWYQPKNKSKYVWKPIKLKLINVVFLFLSEKKRYY
jgi:hypothetical protein